jgi:hypothetical protein
MPPEPPAPWHCDSPGRPATKYYISCSYSPIAARNSSLLLQLCNSSGCLEFILPARHATLQPARRMACPLPLPATPNLIVPTACQPLLPSPKYFRPASYRLAPVADRLLHCQLPADGSVRLLLAIPWESTTCRRTLLHVAQAAPSCDPCPPAAYSQHMRLARHKTTPDFLPLSIAACCQLLLLAGPRHLHGPKFLEHPQAGTCGLVAMTSAQHAEGRQFDPGQVYCLSTQPLRLPEAPGCELLHSRSWGNALGCLV